MKKVIIIALLWVNQPLFAMDFGEALEKKLIAATFDAQSLRITNIHHARLEVRVPVGWIFPAEDPNYQNRLVLEEVVVALAPRERQTVKLLTACARRYMATPSVESTAFLLGALAEQPLLDLVRWAAEKNYVRDNFGTIQHLIWDFISFRKLLDESKKTISWSVRGHDTKMLSEAAQIIHTSFDIPLSKIEIVPTAAPLRISTINTSVDLLLDKPLRAAKLCAYDTAGERVHTYFENRSIPAGYFHYPFALNHTQGDSSIFRLELSDNQNVILDRPLLISDTIVRVDRIQTDLLRFQYAIPQEQRADLGVYDSEGRLYHLIREDFPFKAGNHITELRLTTYLPPRDEYIIAIKDKTGKIWSQQKMFARGEAPKSYPQKVVRGTFQFSVEKPMRNVRVAIYDEKNNLIREIYHNSNFGMGYKQINYAFVHTQGPEADFYLRIEDQSTKAVFFEHQVKR
ncbi:MAG: hypothetical protein ACFCUI_01770 [Bernardetiaceae bacterium]